MAQNASHVKLQREFIHTACRIAILMRAIRIILSEEILLDDPPRRCLSARMKVIVGHTKLAVFFPGNQISKATSRLNYEEQETLCGDRGDFTCVDDQYSALGAMGERSGKGSSAVEDRFR